MLIQALNADTRVLRPLLSQVASIKSQSENQLVISLNKKVVILFKQFEYTRSEAVDSNLSPISRQSYCLLSAEYGTADVIL